MIREWWCLGNGECHAGSGGCGSFISCVDNDHEGKDDGNPE